MRKKVRNVVIACVLSAAAGPCQAQGVPPPPPPTGAPYYITPPTSASGTTIIPITTSAVDDHSYLGMTLAGLRDDSGRVKLPPGLLALSAQTIAGRRLVVAVPALLYSNTAGGYDLAVTPYVTGNQGFSLGWRQDLSPAFRRFKSSFTDIFKTRENDTRSFAEKRDVSVARFNASVRAIRPALTVNYRHLDDSNAELLSAGLSASKLRVLRRVQEVPQEGLLIAASVHGLRLVPEAGEDRSAIQLGVRVAWQDQVPYVYPGGGKMLRWRWQTGIEYTSDNAVTRGDVVALYVRFRRERHVEDGTLERDHAQDSYRAGTNELALSAGKGADDRPFVGLKVTHVFGL